MGPGQAPPNPLSVYIHWSFWQFFIINLSSQRNQIVPLLLRAEQHAVEANQKKRAGDDCSPGCPGGATGPIYEKLKSYIKSKLHPTKLYTIPL